MTNEPLSNETKEALVDIGFRIGEMLKQNKVKPVESQPTEELIGTMEKIFIELRLRFDKPSTKTLQELPIGAKIRDKGTSYYGAPVIWLKANSGEQRTTLLAEKILSFKAFDAKEPNNPDEKRARWGNNYYPLSNIAQWLNSNKEEWFTPSHEYDQAPTESHVTSRPYVNEKGFLTNFSDEFLQRLKDSSLGKVFLLSAEEVGLSDIGKALPLFTGNESRKAYPSEECIRIDNEGELGEPDWWWLRTPYAANSFNSRFVRSAGALSYSSAYYGNNGVRPALNLPSEIRVTAKPDQNGIYDIVWGPTNA